MWEVFRVQSDDKGGTPLLCTRADCVIVRIGRHVAFLANIYELCLLTQQVDDLPDDMPSYTEPRENYLVLRKDLLRYEPDKGSMLKPITKK